MFAPFALLQSFIKHMRRPARTPEAAGSRSQHEQRELELWLFDRDSRWEQ